MGFDGLEAGGGSAGVGRTGNSHLLGRLEHAGATAVGRAPDLSERCDAARRGAERDMPTPEYRCRHGTVGDWPVAGFVGMPPAMYPAIFDELARFAEWDSSRAERVFDAFHGRLNQVASGQCPDPNGWDEIFRRIQHTEKHGREWFGVDRPLTSTELQEWARVLERVSRSSIQFSWDTKGQATNAFLGRIDGKWLCVQYFLDGRLATAYAPGAAQLSAMLKAAGYSQ